MRDRLPFNRISSSPKNILLLGPRQAGKSTLCRALAPRRIIDLADEQIYLAHAKDAGLLKRELAAESFGLIVIDEVQRLPSLLNTVQSLADDPANSFRFVLTGSSARKLKRGEDRSSRMASKFCLISKRFEKLNTPNLRHPDKKWTPIISIYF